MIRMVTSEDVYESVDEAELAHGRVKLAYTSIGDKVLDDGDYYLPIPETCPYSGVPCVGGGCSPCEYVP